MHNDSELSPKETLKYYFSFCLEHYVLKRRKTSALASFLESAYERDTKLVSIREPNFNAVVYAPTYIRTMHYIFHSLRHIRRAPHRNVNRTRVPALSHLTRIFYPIRYIHNC